MHHQSNLIALIAMRFVLAMAFGYAAKVLTQSLRSEGARGARQDSAA